MGTCEVLGVPFSGGQPRGGVEYGPQVLRAEGVISSLEELGWDMKDLGDLELPAQPAHESECTVQGRVKNPSWVGSVTKALADATEQIVERDHFPLILGGDHSIAVGTVAGMARQFPNLGVIWVDAHADINTSGSTPSGNLHGMPVSFLMGLTPPVKGFEWLDMDNPPLGLDQLVYIGLRDLEKAEMKFLREHSIKCFDMHDVDRLGIGTVMDNAIKIMGARPIHLSFDIDALDPREAPSTGTAVRGGLTFREGTYICEYVHDTGNLVSMELVEVNPSLGSDADVRLTVKSAISMLRCALGETLTTQNTRPLLNVDELFERFDVNKDGTLTKQEFERGLRELHRSGKL